MIHKYIFSPRITIKDPRKLSDLDTYKDSLSIRGVYFLYKGNKPRKNISLTNNGIFYIGKAINETIFSRCKKHSWAITNKKTNNGRQKVYPGKKMKSFRYKVNYKLNDLWVISGEMNKEKSWEISCMEDYLLYKFKKKNKDYPLANTARRKFE